MMIRKILAKDAQTFANMLLQLDSETDYMLYEPGERQTSVEETRERIERAERTDSVIFVAFDGENMVGFLSAERGCARRIRHSAYVVIGILSRYRGKKIGTRLFEELSEWAGKHQVTRLELTVMTPNKAGVGLYQKMGFKTEGLKEKSIVENGKYIDEYYMAKILQ